MLKPPMNSDQILRMAYANMTLDQLIQTRDKLYQQIGVLEQLIVEQSPSEEVTPDA